MRWLIFTLLAVTALTVQTTLAPRLAPLGIRADWLLTIVVFFSLCAPRRDALVAAWLIGALADLMTIERFGLVAASYILASGLIISVRDYLFRYRATTGCVVTLLACLFVRTLWAVYGHTLYDLNRSLPAILTLDVLLPSVYTALWALPVHQGLRWMSRAFGLVRARYVFAT